MKKIALTSAVAIASIFIATDIQVPTNRNDC